uniref:EGF-like domain-containing protein n=1 Tax=Hucho hucho TaxID=62062 RepID=A0A4W5PMP0_9TELE
MALYVCHPGYTPMPRATQSICGGQGAWSQPPVCQDMDECLSEPCKHGGTCEDQPGSYYCHCQQGFMGPDCEIGTAFTLSGAVCIKCLRVADLGSGLSCPCIFIHYDLKVNTDPKSAILSRRLIRTFPTL